MDGQMFETRCVSLLLHLACQTLQSMRCIRDTLQSEGFKGREFVEQVEELADAKVLLHFVFSVELYIDQFQLQESTPEVLPHTCDSLVL